MGLVLAFQTAPRAASRTPQRRPEPARSADILFFTGVRFERHAEPAAAASRRTADAPDFSPTAS